MRSRWNGSLVLVLSASALLAGCSSSSVPKAPGTTSKPAVEPSPASVDNGTVRLRLEKISGMLTEGFRLKVHLESGPGHELVSSTWQDLVHEQSSDPKTADLYRSVINFSVPPGPFTLSTVMHPGMESEQPVCVSNGRLAAGAVVTVTVRFSAANGCSTLS